MCICIYVLVNLYLCLRICIHVFVFVYSYKAMSLNARLCVAWVLAEAVVGKAETRSDCSPKVDKEEEEERGAN